MGFVDRADAGRRLATKLQHLRASHVVVLGLPRGGVPVAYEVARSLGAPLDVILVRKLGLPFQPELAMGAIGEGGVRILNEGIVRTSGVSSEEVSAVETRERAELQRRSTRFRGGRPRIPLEGRVAVVVDDGIATGSTARAACRVARAQGAARVVLAVPVAPLGWESRIADDADELVCLGTPEPFVAIGQFYEDFAQTSDDEVVDYLARSVSTASPAGVSGASSDNPAALGGEVGILAGPLSLEGTLTIPPGATSVVVFAHGSGSSRHSPRNRYVAGVLNQAGLGTLLFDLLTPQEELNRANVFDVGLLGERLIAAEGWLRAQPVAAQATSSIGFFGASTGAAAALWAAAEPGSQVRAVVSRGGRPDLAAARLAHVRAPTLLIVGGEDTTVLDLNRKAQSQLRCESRLTIVEGATHLFEEPGTLRAAAEAASDWFVTHLHRGA